MIMEREMITFITAVIFVGLSSVRSEASNYIVMVPSKMRAGRQFDISVHTFNGEGELFVKAEILNSTNYTIASNERKFEDGTQVTISLQVPVEGIEHTHRVRVEGSGAVDFVDETEVSASSTSVIVLIQTDKAMYKPGQTVKFRCMGIYSDLKPYLGPLDIRINDNKQNKMAQWTDVKGPFGVFGAEFPLASSPLLGNWEITCSAKMGGIKFTNFKVEKYVLPKVETKIELPPFFHESRLPLAATVSAMYTYGKPVVGTAEITFGSSGGYYSKNNRQIVRRVSLKNGKAEMLYEKEDFEQLYVCTYSKEYCEKKTAIQWLRGRRLKISATITDNVTGEIHLAEERIQLKYNLFNLKFLEVTPNTFKDGLNWTGFLQLTLPDGTPPLLSDTANKLINVSYEFRRRAVQEDGTEVSFKRTLYQQYDVPSSGLVLVEIAIPKDMSACKINVMFQAGDYTYTSVYKEIKRYMSRDNQGFQILAPDLKGTVQPEDDVKFLIKNVDSVEQYYYQLLSKNRIVQQGNKRNTAGTEFEFTIKFDADLCQKTAPNARIVVWYTTSMAEIITDSIEFNVNGAFANPVTISYNKEKVNPADNISLVVSTHPNSFVGLLAVDQSTLLLKKGNDITKDQVLSGLNSFQSGTNPFPADYYFYCYYPRSLAGQDSKTVFKNVGVNIMTDFHIHDAGYVDHGCYGDSYGYERGPAYYDNVMDSELSYSPSSEAISASSSSRPSLKTPDRVRNVFPETWIWTDAVSGKDGKVTLSATAPDTITSWVASAFSMNEDVGLGIADETSKVTVFKEFFAQIDLPFSSIRGESLELKVLVYNYLDSTQEVTVTLEKPPNEEFYAWNEGEQNLNESQEIVQNVEIKSGDGIQLTFWISPVKLGQVPVQVKAQSIQAADALKRMLLVEPEGIPQVYTKSFYIGVDSEKTFHEQLNITFPADVIPDSEKVTFSAIGDIMGPTMKNLGSLLRMPYGCGEQNMLDFAPNIFVLEYLNATNELKSDLAKRAENFMLKGYQNQLQFRRYGGSFSAFGSRDHAGSTWLTAFVIRSFHRAKPYITMDQSIIDGGVRYLLNMQRPDGSFHEANALEIVHTDMQGSASEGTPLTAYVLFTLIEVKDSLENTHLYENFTTKVDNAIYDAFHHLVAKLPLVKHDVYAMSLITYAFTLYGHPLADEVFHIFDSLATVDTTAGTKYWKRYEPEIFVNDCFYCWRPPYRQQPSNSIEMTAYGVFIHLLRKDISGASAIIKWLSSQRNGLGGYRSTQDTVVGIDALAQFASRIIPDGRQNVDIYAEGDMKYTFDTITKANFDVLQQIEVEDRSTSKLNVRASGNGAALAQMSVSYNKEKAEDTSGFSMNITSVYTSYRQLTTTICFSYNVANTSSGMVVLEIGQPTGHVPITGSLVSHYRIIGLKKVEILRGKKLVLYLDEVYQHAETCIDIKSAIYQRVDNLKPAVCKIYSYYKTELVNTQLYLPH